MGRTHHMITSLSAHFTRIAVGDCRDGIIYFLIMRSVVMTVCSVFIFQPKL